MLEKLGCRDALLLVTFVQHSRLYEPNHFKISSNACISSRLNRIHFAGTRNRTRGKTADHYLYLLDLLLVETRAST